ESRLRATSPVICRTYAYRTRSCTEPIMSRPTSSLVIIRGSEDQSPASRFRRIAYKSALLNAVIVLTSFPVLALAGGPTAVVPTLMIMAGLTLLIWTATFALFSCATIVRLLWTTFSSKSRRKPPMAVQRVGVADRWLDGPG